jgi:hypothetical protein
MSFTLGPNHPNAIKAIMALNRFAKSSSFEAKTLSWTRSSQIC